MKSSNLITKDTPKMLPHQERIVQEKLDLDNKISTLDSFMKGPNWQYTPDAEKLRLMEQIQVMERFSSILKNRIDHFDQSPAQPEMKMPSCPTCGEGILTQEKIITGFAVCPNGHKHKAREFYK